METVTRMRKFVLRLVEWRRLLASGLLALCAVGLMTHVLLGNNGWLSYRQKQAEYRKLQEQKQHMDEDNQRLEAEIKALKTDPRTIEREAREQLRYAKPGEIIYLMPEQPGQHSSPATPQTDAQRR